MTEKFNEVIRAVAFILAAPFAIVLYFASIVVGCLVSAIVLGYKDGQL
jgi:low affinity Fe/Cu permease